MTQPSATKPLPRLRRAAPAFAALTAAALLAFGGAAHAADAYPNHPIRWVVGYPPGGTTDILARVMAQRLSQTIGQQVIVDNHPGAGNNIGTELVAKAAPDGYTVLLVNPANAINVTLYKGLSFDFGRDIVGVAGIVRVPNVMEVTTSLPVQSIAEFIAYAKGNPGKVAMASSGSGTSVHLSGELFKMMAGIDMLHVPYKGAGPALVDLIAGQTQVMFDNLPSSIEHIRNGKLRALGVTTANRNSQLPDVPAIGEVVKGYEAINRLNKEMNDALNDPKTRAELIRLGGDLIPGTPKAFDDMNHAEIEKWSKVVKASGAKVE